MQENILDTPSLESEEIQRAKLWKRLLASIIDVFILIIFAVIISWVNKGSLFLIITFVISIFYKLGMEYRYGATVGKMIFMIRIVSLRMETLNLSQVILRNIIIIANQSIRILMLFHLIDQESQFRIVVPLVLIQSIFGIVLCIDAIVLLFNRNDQALHDLMAKTIVIQKVIKSYA